MAQPGTPKKPTRTRPKAKPNRARESVFFLDPKTANITYGKYNPETGKIDKIDSEAHLQKFSPKGRKLRKSFERPRPDLPADASENRSRKVVSVTLPPDLIAAATAEAKALGVDRSTFIEHAIRLALAPKLTL